MSRSIPRPHRSMSDPTGFKPSSYVNLERSGRLRCHCTDKRIRTDVRIDFTICSTGHSDRLRRNGLLIPVGKEAPVLVTVYLKS